jgi:hypothetical protein
MLFATLAANLRPSLFVTSLRALLRSILVSMGLDHVFVDFLSNAALGTAAALLVIFFVAIGIPRRSPATIRRIIR